MISYTTRLTPATSLVMREEIVRRTLVGKSNQSAVMKSSVVTARRQMTCSRIRYRATIEKGRGRERKQEEEREH